MSKIAELKADIPNYDDGVLINVYSTTSDMKNDEYSNDYILVEAEYGGEYHKECPIAVTYSNTNDAYKAYGTPWTVKDADGNTCYVMTEPYLPSTPTPEPTITGHVCQPYLWYRIPTSSSIGKNARTNDYNDFTLWSNNPFCVIPNTDMCRIVWKLTISTGESRFCSITGNYTDWDTIPGWGNVIEDGWWFKRPPYAMGKVDGTYYWEQGYCFWYENGIGDDIDTNRSEYPYFGGYNIWDYDNLWRLSYNDDVPSISRQPDE